VRRRVRDHAHLHLGGPAGAAAGALRTVDARHAGVVQQLAPGAVGEDHQLGDDLVERRAALAAHDRHDVVLDVEVEVDPVGLLGLQAKRLALFHAARFQLQRPFPQQRQLGLVRVLALAVFQRLFVDQVVKVVVAQVALDRHQLGTGAGRDHRPVGRAEDRVQRQRRAVVSLCQRERVDDLVRQHRDLVTRHIDGRHARARNLVDGVVRLDAQARGGDVDAHAHRAVGQFLDRERVVDLGGGHVVDRERGHAGQRQAGRRAGHRHRREAGAAREILEQEARHVQFLGRGNAASI
jgi:hypothetical protein